MTEVSTKGSALDEDRGRAAGRVHVVTGGASGIGAAVASSLAAVCGDSVVVVDIDQDAGEALSRALRDRGHDAAFHRADVSSPAEVDRLFVEVVAGYGGVDTLVCCAGMLGPMAFSDTTPESWSAVMRVNLDSGFLLARRAIPLMAERGGGRIVMIASVNGRKPGPYLVPYRVSKAALLMLVHCLALEAATHRITVNAVCPGVVLTPMQRRVIAQKVGESPEATAAYVAQRRAGIPLGRLVEGSDVAGVVRFLLSPEAAMCTGQEILVDGGEYQAL